MCHLIYASTVSAGQAEEYNADIDEPTCSGDNLMGSDTMVTPCSADMQKFRMPDDCQLVYAEVPTNIGGDEQARWATYTISPRKKGTPVLKHGDIVIQWTDPIHQSLKNEITGKSALMLQEYTWNGQETGGNYEGETLVESVVTGIGMTSRPTSDKSSINILPLVPRVDDGSLTRFDSPGAGAITRYHNYTSVQALFTRLERVPNFFVQTTTFYYGKFGSHEFQQPTT